MCVYRTLTMLAVLITCTIAANGELINNGGFEFGTPVLGPRPITYGQWRGDKVNYVGAANGIQPFAGAKMLQFINSEYIPNTTDSSQYWQNIDLLPYASEIATGRARLSLSVDFNRVAGDSQTDSQFVLDAYFRSGTPSSFTTLSNPGASIYSDANPTTWERASLRSFLPVGTDYAMVEIYARENVFNDQSNPEFDGHYADNVIAKIDIVPEILASGSWSGNGHRYEVIFAGPQGISWTNARDAAAQRGGYLATVGSAAENNFIYQLTTERSECWFTDNWNNGVGPWLGGRQSSDDHGPGGDWAWVTGESWSYQNWSPVSPIDDSGNEDYLHLLGYQKPTEATWNDYGDYGWIQGYVVEYGAPDVAPVPEPSTLVLWSSLGAMGLVAAWRRKRAA